MTPQWATEALHAARRAQATVEVRATVLETVDVKGAAKAFKDHAPRVERMLRAVLTAQRHAGHAASPDLRATIDGALAWVKGQDDRRRDDRRWSSEQVSILHDAWRVAVETAAAEEADTAVEAGTVVAAEVYADWLRRVRQAVRAGSHPAHPAHPDAGATTTGAAP